MFESILFSTDWLELHQHNLDRHIVDGNLTPRFSSRLKIR